MTSANLPSVPRVSIVIPVRNGKDFIHEAINSVITQGFLNLEVIVVDDGSNDYDYKQLEDMDPRIRVLRLDGYGVSRARNTGMRVAQGEFIAFLDADDVWFPGKLEAQIRYFDQHRNIGVVFGQFVKWHADSRGVFASAQSIWSNCADLVRSDAQRSGWIYTKLLMGLLVGMNTAVIRRSIYYQIGEFNEAMRIEELDSIIWVWICHDSTG